MARQFLFLTVVLKVHREFPKSNQGHLFRGFFLLYTSELWRKRMSTGFHTSDIVIFDLSSHLSVLHFVSGHKSMTHFFSFYNLYLASDQYGICYSFSTHITDLLDFDCLSDFANLRVFEVHEHYRLKTRASKLQRVMSDIISALAKNTNLEALETLNIPGRV